MAEDCAGIVLRLKIVKRAKSVLDFICSASSQGVGTRQETRGRA